MLELAKCLKLVAPVTMSADAQLVWLQAAVDALEGIHAHEVAAVSAEVRRKCTRHSQIVPLVSDLVAEHRKRASFKRAATGTCRCGRGEAAAKRQDVHWIKIDGESRIEFCD